MDNCVDLDPMEFRDPSPARLVESLISSNKVVIFSKSSCPHCDNSKSLLTGMGVDFTAVELDQMQEGRLVQKTLGQMTNAKTVPRIFINGECVGGNSDLQSLGNSGKLERLLKLRLE